MRLDLPYDFSRIGEAGLLATVHRRRITAGFDRVKADTGYARVICREKISRHLPFYREDEVDMAVAQQSRIRFCG